MEFWDEVKKDMQKGINEGMSLVKTGATLASRKFYELTDEGKRWYKAFDLKSKVHAEVAELGARIYSLAKDEKIELEDARAKSIIKRIAALEIRIAKVEGQKPSGSSTSKTPARKKAVRKTRPASAKAGSSGEKNV